MTTIRKYILTIFIISVLTMNASAALIFEDTFQGTSIDESKWRIYGNEPQRNGDSSFNPDNVIVNNGLHIRINRFDGNGDNFGKNYVGGGLDNSGYRDITHGRWEIRARFPGGEGLVGYVGIFTSQDWPPEIDFAETSGSKPNQVEFTQHWDPDDKTEMDIYNADITQFHTYTVDVLENNQIKWYVDGKLVVTQEQYFDDVPWHIAIGTWAGNCYDNWPGCPVDTPLPEYVDIDYIRIYDSIPTESQKDATIFVRKDDGSLLYRAPTTNWNNLGGIITDDPDATMLNNNVYTFARGTDNALWYKSTDGSVDWTNLGGIITSSPGVAQLNGHVYAFARGTDNALWYRSSDGATDWTSLGGILNSGPGVTEFNNKIYVFVRGTDNTLWYRTQDGSIGWASLGGIIADDPDASVIDGKIYVFARGADNTIWYRTIDGTIDWTSLGGITMSSPGATSDYIFVRGTNNALWYKKYTGSWSEWTSLGGILNSGPGAAP